MLLLPVHTSPPETGVEAWRSCHHITMRRPEVSCVQKHVSAVASGPMTRFVYALIIHDQHASDSNSLTAQTQILLRQTAASAPLRTSYTALAWVNDTGSCHRSEQTRFGTGQLQGRSHCFCIYCTEACQCGCVETTRVDSGLGECRAGAAAV